MSLYKSISKINSSLVTSYEVPQVILHNDQPLVLSGKIATIDDNPALASAVRAKFGKRAARTDKDGDDRMLHIARELYPHHVFTGWNVVNEGGTPVKFDPEQCSKILRDLDGHAVVSLVMHFTDVNVFRESLTKTDGAEVGNASGK